MTTIQYSFLPKKLLFQIVFLSFVLAGLSVQAQTTKQTSPKTAFTLNYEGRDLKGFLEKETRYPASIGEVTDSCKALVVSACVSFVVDAGGKVSTISFSDNAHPSIQTELKRVLNKTINHWKATGAVKHQTMILPLIFQRRDCIDKTVDGLKGGQYQNSHKAVFDFIYTKSSTGKAVILPTLEVVGGKAVG
ncbi:hypothetical protein QNI19_35535 [Cytophagaceae bacterium DM2B3-1]|uniref:TonB C-terminal domain-containing protein n=1 Tax=Xanthocytophaga flava TaxID=3048013 RepID=A0ABT7CX41_9BACT|nr:hypothetical protein [Xanthocytophaga flavus]MDJ1498302.1 hypothetical protein [Xanthocytophaga flavus]